MSNVEGNKLTNLWIAIACFSTIASCSWTAAAENRTIAITADTPAHEVSRYFSMYAHGPTKKFYRVPDASSVVVVTTGVTEPDIVATIHIFPEATSPKAIDKWINNRHSDALYPDAAKPERAIDIPAERLRTTASEPLDHEVGPNGDEYDRVRVDFTIDAFQDGDVTVKPSRSSLNAFLRTKDLPQRR